MNACEIYVRVHNSIQARSYFCSYCSLLVDCLRRSENQRCGLREQTEQARALDAAIWKNLEELGYSE